MWVNLDEPCVTCGNPRRDHQRNTGACPVGKKYGQAEHETYSTTTAFRREGRDGGRNRTQRT